MATSNLLLDSLRHSTEPSEPHQLSTFTRVKPDGHLMAIVNATSTVLRLRADYRDLQGRTDGEHITVVTRSLAPIFSSPQIRAWQGRIAQQPEWTGFLPKGARTRGYNIAELGDLLDVIPGSGPKALAEARKRIESVTHLFVRSEALAPDSFSALPVTSHDTFDAPCTMAVMTTLHSPDRSRVDGALWLLRDRIPSADPLGDTLNGVLIVPPSTLASEHGSICTSRLSQATAVLPLTTPIPWSRAVDLTTPGAYLSAIDQLTDSATA